MDRFPAGKPGQRTEEFTVAHLKKPEVVPCALAVHLEKPGNRHGGGSRYGHLRAGVSKTVIGELGFPEGDYGHDLGGLVASCQADDGTGKDRRRTYGWEFKLREGADGVTLYQAQQAVRRMTPIERRMDKMRDVEGYPQTFGAYINRLARAIGATCVFVESNPERSGTRIEYKRFGLGDSIRGVDDLGDVLLNLLVPVVREDDPDSGDFPSIRLRSRARRSLPAKPTKPVPTCSWWPDVADNDRMVQMGHGLYACRAVAGRGFTPWAGARAGACLWNHRAAARCRARLCRLGGERENQMTKTEALGAALIAHRGPGPFTMGDAFEAGVAWALAHDEPVEVAPPSGTEALTDEYLGWQRDRGLKLGSADEHLNDPALTQFQRDWLAIFVQQWDRAVADERRRDYSSHDRESGNFF